MFSTVLSLANNNDMNNNNNMNMNNNNNKMDIQFFLHSDEQQQQQQQRKTSAVDNLNNDNNNDDNNNKTCVLDILSLIHSGEQTPRAEEMLPGWRPGNNSAKRLLEDENGANDLSPKRHKKVIDLDLEDEDPFVVVADDCVSDACTEPVDQTTLDAYFAPLSSEKILDTDHLDNQSPLREEEDVIIIDSDGEDQDRQSLDGDQDQDDQEDSDASSTSSYEGSLQSLYMSQQMKDPEISLHVLHALCCGPRPSAAPRWQASLDGLQAPCTDPVYRAFCKAKNTKGTFSRHTAYYVIHP